MTQPKLGVAFFRFLPLGLILTTGFVIVALAYSYLPFSSSEHGNVTDFELIVDAVTAVLFPTLLAWITIWCALSQKQKLFKFASAMSLLLLLCSCVFIQFLMVWFMGGSRLGGFAFVPIPMLFTLEMFGIWSAHLMRGSDVKDGIASGEMLWPLIFGVLLIAIVILGGGYYLLFKIFPATAPSVEFTLEWVFRPSQQSQIERLAYATVGVFAYGSQIVYAAFLSTFLAQKQAQENSLS